MPLIKTALNERFVHNLTDVFRKFTWNGLDYVSYMKKGFSDDEDFIKNTFVVNFMKYLKYEDYDFDEERTISTGRFDKIIKNGIHQPLIVIETKNSLYRKFDESDR